MLPLVLLTLFLKIVLKSISEVRISNFLLEVTELFVSDIEITTYFNELSFVFHNEFNTIYYEKILVMKLKRNA